MSNEVARKAPTEIDGFTGYEDAVEGEERASNRTIQGSLVRFTNETTWMAGEEELSPDLELVAINIIRVVQRWHDDKPPETRVLEPGEKFPNVKALNDAVPQEEWTEGPDGRPRGPWQNQHIVYLLDPRTMGKYSYPTGTIGGSIAVRDLVDRTQWMRRFRGAGVFPVVRLSDTFMNTRFGGRQRPHFNVIKWITLDGDGGGVLSPTTPPALSGPQTVEVPSAKEITGDEVKF